VNIYIGGFAPDVTEEDLREVFEPFGQVSDVKIIKDKYAGASRGFAFIEMPSKQEAQEAINGVREIQGRMVTVNEARPRADSRSHSKRGFRGDKGRNFRSNRY